MLKSISFLKQFSCSTKLGFNLVKDHVLSPNQNVVVKTPCRTTFILRRKYPVPLVKKQVDPSTYKLRKKRSRVYEFVQYTESLPESKINVILTSFVEGLGEEGDVVSVKRSYAYDKLLIPGLATYATPEALEKFAAKPKPTEKDDEKPERLYSSLHVPRTMNYLSSLILGITMNKENNWTLEPWHVKTSFRKAGIHLREECIEMPKEKIKGPDMNLEGKEFLITVIINKRERVNVRCRIHHWSTNIVDRSSHTPMYWTVPAEPLFKEEAELLSTMPLPTVLKSKAS